MKQDNKVKELHRDYGGMAPTYEADRFTGRSGRFLYEVDRRIVREAVSVAAPTKILDVPTGTGRVLDYLKGQSAPITGLDSTPGMLAQASRHARRGYDELLIGNAASLPFSSGTFDCVISLRFFHLFNREERVPFAQEFDRVLRPQGHLFLSMTNGWYAGGVNWVKRGFGRRTVHFEYPGELSRLFPGWLSVRVFGNFVPLHSFANSVPFLGSGLRWACDHFPLNRLCWETYHLLRKP